MMKVLHVSDKLVIARISHTIRPVLSWCLLFCSYFAVISRENMRYSENTAYNLLVTMRLRIHITIQWKKLSLKTFQKHNQI